MAEKTSGCSYVSTSNGEKCPLPNYAKGMCRVHYHRARKGRPMDRPPSEKGAVQLPIARVKPEVAAAVKDQAKRDGVSEYEFLRRVIYAWYEGYLEVNPGAEDEADAPTAVNIVRHG